MSSTKQATPTSPKRPAAPTKRSAGLTSDERAALSERLEEIKTQSRRPSRSPATAGESEVLARLAALPLPDRAIAERIHAIIKAIAPQLSPKTWYGMPAYAKDGHVLVFFQSAHKFKTRYATLGFTDKARLDDGLMWPAAFALSQLTAVEEERIAALVRRAVA